MKERNYECLDIYEKIYFSCNQNIKLKPTRCYNLLNLTALCDNYIDLSENRMSLTIPDDEVLIKSIKELGGVSPDQPAWIKMLQKFYKP